jgi:hypothetical protein
MQGIARKAVADLIESLRKHYAPTLSRVSVDRFVTTNTEFFEEFRGHLLGRGVGQSVPSAALSTSPSAMQRRATVSNRFAADRNFESRHTTTILLTRAKIFFVFEERWLADFDILLAERAAFMQQVQTSAPGVSEAARIFADAITLAGVVMIKLANLPLSKGYEPYLVEAGTPRIAARDLANWPPSVANALPVRQRIIRK